MSKKDPECKSVTECVKEGSKYVNPWGKWPHGYYLGFPKLMKWMFNTGIKILFPDKDVDENLPIYEPYFVNNLTLDEYISNLKVTWLGHASILLEIDGFKILCDPVFSTRCGPYNFGVSRYRNAPCTVENLPKIDAVAISHNHYDHMDTNTIIELNNKQSDIKWMIPDGDRDFIKNLHIDPKQIIDLKWWECCELTNSNENKLKVVFTPTQHWSNRGLFDAFKSLWGSFAFIGPNSRFWFGGDTGYCGAFKEIGDNYGPFNGAAIPIGAYEPRELLGFQHANPEDALKIHQDIKSEVSIGIHWGTFTLSEENYMNPKKDLEKCVSNEDVKFITINHGQTIIIEKNKYSIIQTPKKTEINKMSSTKPEVQIEIAETAKTSLGN